MRHLLLSILLLSLWLISPSPLAAQHGIPVIYTVGNVDGISAGDSAELRLEESTLVVHSGDMDLVIPYTQVQTAEMGAKLTPARKGLKLRKDSARRTLTIEFADANTKAPAKGEDSIKSITLQMDASICEDAQQTIDERSGKHRKTNGDSWWGDSAWKTNRNGQTVKPDSIGKLEN